MIWNAIILLMKRCDSYETRQIFDFDHKTPVYTKSERGINFIQCKTENTLKKICQVYMWSSSFAANSARYDQTP